MRIRGLSFQWGDKLLESFAPDPNSHEFEQECNLAMIALLRFMESVEGPDLWGGTSHSQLNLTTHDFSEFQDVSTLVTVNAYIAAVSEPFCHYRIGYPLPPELRAWDDAWVYGNASSLESAAAMILTALASSGANPDRERSSWLWFVCPKCDFHATAYSSRCERCGVSLPPEKRMQAVGLYRTAYTADTPFDWL